MNTLNTIHYRKFGVTYIVENLLVYLIDFDLKFQAVAINMQYLSDFNWSINLNYELKF